MSMTLLGRLPAGACFCTGGKLWLVVTSCCHGTVDAQSPSGERRRFLATRHVLRSSQGVFLNAEAMHEKAKEVDVHAT